MTDLIKKGIALIINVLVLVLAQLGTSVKGIIDSTLNIFNKALVIIHTYFSSNQNVISFEDEGTIRIETRKWYLQNDAKGSSDDPNRLLGVVINATTSPSNYF